MSIPQRRATARPAAGRRVTITDVAHAAGVSIAVVSYALNGRPGVSESTRRHVLRVAEDLGWRPNAAARSMRSSHVASIALQTLDGLSVTHSAPAGLELAAGLRATVPDVALAVEVALDRAAGAGALEAAWTERRHSAFVVQDLLLDDPRARTAERVRAPVVAVTPPGLGTAGVPHGLWFAGGAESAVGRYLADLGHRRFVLLVQDARVDVARALHAGLLDAAAGLRASVDVVEATSAPEAGAAAARLFTSPERPTAIVTDGDVTALAVLEAARHRDLSVPWDVSVVSGADAETCRLVEPQLTAISRPWRDLAPALVTALGADEVSPWSSAAPGHPADDGEPATPVPPAARLVIRGTTAPPPARVGP